MLRVMIAVLALSLGAGSASAQSIRAFTTFRQLHGETRLRADLDYRAGGLRVAPGRPTELYRMDASYDEDRYLPTSDFNAARGAVSLGLQPAGDSGTPESASNPDFEIHLHFEIRVGDTYLGAGLDPAETRAVYEAVFGITPAAAP